MCKLVSHNEMETKKIAYELAKKIQTRKHNYIVSEI